VPQYFVMVGGGTTDAGASFARTAAKIPARRIADAVERLIDMYAAQKSDGESAVAFFQRIELPRVTAVLNDLQQMTAEQATSNDFIDLAETAEFTPEVMEGECSA
jgi:sulfite reductase (NADPH) hemoprotein beta-component